MRAALELLRRDPQARLFFAAYSQSALGTGIAYVALLALAHDRFRSPWAVSLILMAEFVPSAVLGSVAGALADRYSRRTCLIVADVLRGSAFLALALVGSFEATLALAVVAGVGNALFNPALMAALPALATQQRLAAVNGLYGTITELGFVAGPAIAAAAFLVTGAPALMVVNGMTFFVSALAITRLRLDGGHRAAAPSGPASAQGWGVGSARVVTAYPGVLALVLSSSALVLFLGTVNVAELLLAKEELDAGAAGYSILVATMGIGASAGSMLGARGGSLSAMKRRYLIWFAICGLALVTSGLVPSMAAAIAVFAILGVANGAAQVYDRTLLQRALPDRVLGRVFGVRSMAISWAFGTSFLLAGGVAASIGVRGLLVMAGILALVVWAAAAAALARVWVSRPAVT